MNVPCSTFPSGVVYVIWPRAHHWGLAACSAAGLPQGAGATILSVTGESSAAFMIWPDVLLMRRAMLNS